MIKVFGAAGAGLGALKAKNLTEGISEYGFCSIPKELSEEQKKEAQEGNEIMEEPFVLNWNTKEVEMKDGNPLPLHQEEKPSYLQNLTVTKVQTNNEQLPGYLTNISSPKITEEVSNDNSDDNNEKETDDVDNTGIRVCICIQGWLWKESELTSMWMPMREADPSSEIYSLQWETTELKQLGRCLVKTVTSVAAVQAAKFWIVAMSALAAALFASLALPLAVITVSGAIDNSWTIVHAKAKKVGKMLAQTLVDRVQGRRPVTLFGVSLGAQVVLSCLKQLRKLQDEGHEVDGIIENVFIVGGACTSNPEYWSSYKKIIAGRFVNGFCKTDWVLGLVHRTAGMTFKAAGLNVVDTPTVENIDLTDHISGHLSYKKNLDKVLDILQVGRSICATDWKVDTIVS